MYIMPPCTDRTIYHVPTRCAFTANPAMMFSSRVNYEFVNVDAPHSVPSAEWPAYGITLWFSRVPRDAYPSKKEKQYWSKSMVRILSSAMVSSMPLPHIMQLLPVHHIHEKCTLDKAFQTISGNSRILVLPREQPLHHGQFSVTLSLLPSQDC